MPWQLGFPIWQPDFPTALLGIYSGRVAFPKCREAFTGWQGICRPFRKGRKKVCLGSLASPFGSLAFPQRRWGFTVAGWLSQSAAKHLQGGRVFPVPVGKLETLYALGAWPRIWQPDFPTALLGIYSGRVAFPKRREELTGWQGVSCLFRKSRKKVCLGSVASRFGSLAFPQHLTVAKWLSKAPRSIYGVAGCFPSVSER